MGRGRPKRKVDETEAEAEADDAEDWCFVCKDGGKLIMCDRQGCLKAYHPGCVGKKKASLKNKSWICSRHFCSDCDNSSEYYCLCCCYSVCGICFEDSEFAPLKEKKGLCKKCLELAVRVENNTEDDRIVINSDSDSDSNSDEIDSEDEEEREELLFKEYLEIIMEQEGLAIDDLRSAQLKIEQYNSAKKEMLEMSDSEDENVKGSSSREKGERVMARCKKQKTLNKDRIPQQKKVYFTEFQKGCLASIVPENIKLVYLRRSLVEKLLVQQSDNFEDKVVGSFIGVKRESGNGSGRKSYHLLQVTGIKKIEDVEMNRGVFLQVSGMEPDVHISTLSDGDISEELCADLRQKVKDGLLKKPTVEELEQKARILHQDITKDWIERELIRLQNAINYANEKGRRATYPFSRALLHRLLDLDPSEQQSLLQELPCVTPEVEDVNPPAEDSEGEL
ncbi:hypothetical protein SLE2022_091780 [Rubroshorea leprosula]